MNFITFSLGDKTSCAVRPSKLLILTNIKNKQMSPIYLRWVLENWKHHQPFKYTHMTVIVRKAINCWLSHESSLSNRPIMCHLWQNIWIGYVVMAWKSLRYTWVENNPPISIGWIHKEKYDKHKACCMVQKKKPPVPYHPKMTRSEQQCEEIKQL